jgi:uncharacterized membrane protein
MSVASDVEQSISPPSGVGVLPPAEPRPRLGSIDLMRGIVMVLKVLDHTTGTFWTAPFDPLDADASNPPTYLTRWMTP